MPCLWCQDFFLMYVSWLKSKAIFPAYSTSTRQGVQFLVSVFLNLTFGRKSQHKPLDCNFFFFFLDSRFPCPHTIIHKPYHAFLSHNLSVYIIYTVSIVGLGTKRRGSAKQVNGMSKKNWNPWETATVWKQPACCDR